jgi:hypothetical protein
MPRARTDFTVALSLSGVLLAIGIPALQRGQVRTGAACIAGAIVVLAWMVFVAVRSRK